MSIAEKLTTIAENQQRVYDKGYTDGVDFAPPTEIPSYYKISNLNEVGETELVLDLPSITDFKHFFHQCVTNTTVEHITLNGSQDGSITNMYQCFSSVNQTSDNKLKRITLNCNLSNCTDFRGLCERLAALEVVDGTPIDFSSATSIGNMFYYGNKVKEFRVKPSTIKTDIDFTHANDISNETIQSIIDGLVDLKGQPQKTITFGWVNSPKITTELRDVILGKNWQGSYFDD